MTSTTIFASLQAPVDDTMEMSSPAIRNFDEDIDIDFDDFTGGVPLTEDDQMLEDVEQTRPPTATDDRMSDDGNVDQTVVQEEVMQDDASNALREVGEQDDELIDYGEDDFQDHTFTIDEHVGEPVQPVDPLAQSQNEPLFEAVDEEIMRQPEDITAERVDYQDHRSTANEHGEDFEQPVHVPIHEQANITENNDEEIVRQPEDASIEQAENVVPTTIALGVESSTAQEQAPAEDAASVLPPVEQSSEHQTAGETCDEVTNTAKAVSEGIGESTEQIQAPLSLSTSASVSADAPGTPTDTGLHPTNIRYGDMEWPLFKSKTAPDGLLKDDNLANLSLAELMTHCRQRLALKIGDDVSEDHELTLSFDHLACTLVEVSQRSHTVRSSIPLTVVQNSRASFETSLNDVLEVYLTLYQNDGVHEIPPLQLSLSLQLRFSSSLAMLRQAATGGQGMSDLYGSAHFAQQGQDEGQSQDEDRKYRDDDQEDPAKDEEHYQEDDYEGQPEDGQAYNETSHFDDALEQGNNHEQYAGDDHAKDTHEDEEEEELEALQGDASTSAFVEPGTFEQVRSAEVDKAESAASSMTVQGGSTNGSAGEYDEDIDWEDDSILTASSEQATEGPVDFSTFVTEAEANEAGAETEAAKDHNPPPVQGTGPPTVAEDQDYATAPHLGSEDFLQEFEQPERNDDAGVEETYSYEQANYEDFTGGDFDEQYNANQYEQADSFETQQYDAETAADETQYFDFTNGDGYGHGPEQDSANEQGDGYQATVAASGEHALDEAQGDNADAEADAEGEEDDIGYDDDTVEQHAARKQSQPSTSIATGGSPHGKRSFDEHNGAALPDIDERDAKKARSS